VVIHYEEALYQGLALEMGLPLGFGLGFSFGFSALLGSIITNFFLRTTLQLRANSMTPILHVSKLDCHSTAVRLDFDSTAVRLLIKGR